MMVFARSRLALHGHVSLIPLLLLLQVTASNDIRPTRPDRLLRQRHATFDLHLTAETDAAVLPTGAEPESSPVTLLAA